MINSACIIQNVQQKYKTNQFYLILTYIKIILNPPMKEEINLPKENVNQKSDKQCNLIRILKTILK